MRIYQVLKPDRKLDNLYLVEYTTKVRGRTFSEGTKIIAMEVTNNGIILDAWAVPLKEDGSPDFKKAGKEGDE